MPEEPETSGLLPIRPKPTVNIRIEVTEDIILNVVKVVLPPGAASTAPSPA